MSVVFIVETTAFNRCHVPEVCGVCDTLENAITFAKEYADGIILDRIEDYQSARMQVLEWDVNTRYGYRVWVKPLREL